MPGEGFYNQGLTDIKCHKCGKVICQMLYRGFSTATCADCARRNPGQEAKPIEVREDTRSAYDKAMDDRAEKEDFENFYKIFGRPVPEIIEEVVEAVKGVSTKAVKKTADAITKKINDRKIKLKEPEEDEEKPKRRKSGNTK